MTDPLDLEAIERACARASAGPWEYDVREAELLPPPGSERNSIGRFHAGRTDAGNDGRPLKTVLGVD